MWVYPRACGGTVFLLTKSARYLQLPPSTGCLCRNLAPSFRREGLRPRLSTLRRPLTLHFAVV